MAYVAPNKATFVALFPAFSAVEDAAYDFWAARAGRVVDPMVGCLGEDVDLAAMLITAHYLTLQGIGTGAEAQSAAGGTSGFKRVKSGSLELERADASGSGAGEWAATSYGLRAWPMMRACLVGPRITGTGTLPGYRGRFPHGFA